MFVGVAVGCVAHYDLRQPEESLSSNRNSPRRGVGVAVAAIVAW